jgi:hypothetical protein
MLNQRRTLILLVLGVIALGTVMGPILAAPLRQDGDPLTAQVAQRVLDDNELGPDPLPAEFVFISASDGQTRAQVALGSGPDVDAATDAALAQLDRMWSSDQPPVWLKVDVVDTITPLSDLTLDRPVPFERSLTGIAFDWESGLAFLPGEVVANTLIDHNGKLRMDHIAAYARLRYAYPPALSITPPLDGYAFTTRSHFTDGDTLLELYRGHRMFASITPQQLVEAATHGGNYLAASVRADGSFVYRYLPKSNIVPDDYNIVRHAGTIYAMAELYDVTGDPELLAAIQRAIGYLERATAPCPGQATGVPTLCVVEDGVAKLGGSALGVVALAQYTVVTGDEQYIPLMRDLATWIAEAQLDDGSFISKVDMATNQPTEFLSIFYPGEAILGLTRLYQIDADERWLDVAERAARFLILDRDAGLKTSELPHDHWLLYGINELYRDRPDPIYLEHALRITQTITDSQLNAPPFADWTGSYHAPPYSTPTATRSEGLCAAYQLMRDEGLDDEAARIRDALELGIRFQLQTQFRPESAMYLADPQRVLGGFHRSLDNYEIRNDYIQHNISALLCAARVLPGE